VTNLFELRRLLRDGVRPDLLLLEVLPVRLNGRFSSAQHGEPSVPTERLAWDDLRVVARHDPAERKHLVRDWWVSVVSPWYTHRSRVLARMLPALLPDDLAHADDLANVDASGLTLQDWTHVPAALKRRMIAAVQRDCPTALNDFQLGGEGCVVLDEVLRLCRAEGLPVVLVLMPEGPLFRSWYRQQTWAEVQGFLKGLSRRHGVPLIDAREWLAEEEFFDSHHLLSGGAASFSTRLARDGIAPLLAGGARVSTRDLSAHAHD
jgi:hypothetical protein